MSDSPENNASKAASSEVTEGQFAIQKVYTKDLSFETPHSPEIFAEEWSPTVNMQLSSEASPVNEDLEDLHEVVLTLTVTVNIGEKTAYLIEVQQAGIFHIKGFNEDMMSHMAATVCPNILFPFAREVISDLVTRGGFPQLLLAPVNFEALYTSQVEQKTDEIDSEVETETKH